MKAPIFFTVLLLNFTNAVAAPCCSGSASFPQLITGDNTSQVIVTSTYGNTIGDVDSEGTSVFRAKSNDERTQTLTVGASSMLLDYFQVGLAIPLVRKQRDIKGERQNDTGLGDIAVFSAYEFMPERVFSRFKPRGFVFLNATIPTGRSVYESEKKWDVDAHGRGFASLSFGPLFYKVIHNFDWHLGLQGSFFFSRSFPSNSAGELTISPGPQLSGMLGGGWSPAGGDYRLGASLTPIYQSKKKIEGEESLGADSQYKMVWDANFSLSYAILEDWSVMAIYKDQTLVGPAHNTALNRSFSLQLTKRIGL